MIKLKNNITQKHNNFKKNIIRREDNILHRPC